MKPKGTKEQPYTLRASLWLCVLCTLCVLRVFAEPHNDVIVRTSLDRTAIFVGDRVTYTIDITCARGVDVLADDLSRDRLRLEGLEVVDGDSDRRSGPDGTTIARFRYVLTTYRVEGPTLMIAPLRVRYAVRRAGQPPEEAAPAGEVQVPGATIAFRSALADDEDVAGVRSDKAPPARSRRFTVLRPIGIALIIVSAIPAFVAVAAVVHRARRPRVRRSTRAVRHEERLSLEAVRTMGLDSIERRREALTRLDALVREHLRDVCGVPGHSLTAQEVPSALAAGRTHVPAELVASVLAICELARYAPPQAVPSADACRQAIQQVEQVIAQS
jgi:hypothetical protein